MLLEGHRIIVAGAARGIGAATLHVLVSEGAHVAVVDLLGDEGRAVVDAANQRGPGQARYRHCNIAHRGAVEECVDAAVAELGGLDALVHVAGVFRAGAPEDVEDTQWGLQFDVNVKGALYTNQAAFRHLKERGGRIVNLGSGAGARGMADAAAYSASKAAVLEWTRAAARAWDRYGITVNAMAAGMQTPVYRASRAGMNADELSALERCLGSHLRAAGEFPELDDLSAAFECGLRWMVSELGADPERHHRTGRVRVEISRGSPAVRGVRQTSEDEFVAAITRGLADRNQRAAPSISDEVFGVVAGSVLEHAYLHWLEQDDLDALERIAREHIAVLRDAT